MNVFTKGTETFRGMPIKEDASLMVKIKAFNSRTNIITGVKIWDTSENPQSFYALNINIATVLVGMYALFHRVGSNKEDFPQEPTEFDLGGYIEGSKVSWVCLTLSPILMVRNKGGGTGEEVYLKDGEFTPVSWSEELPIYSTLPILENGVAFGQKISNKYHIFVENIGRKVETRVLEHSSSLYKYTLNLDLTSDGRLLDFSAEAEIIDTTSYNSLLIAYMYFWTGVTGSSNFVRFTNNMKSLYPCTTHPYVVFGGTHSNPAFGFRSGATYMIARVGNFGGPVLPSPFNSIGSNQYVVNLSWGGRTSLFPGGFVYAQRNINNWWTWHDVAGDPPPRWILNDPYVWSYMRALDYRSDENPVAIRQSSDETINEQLEC